MRENAAIPRERDPEKILADFYYACADRLAQKEREVKIAEYAAKFEAGSFKGRLGAAMETGLRSPFSPIVLPLKIFKLWLDEVKTWGPRSLGGSAYKKVLDAWERGGFSAVEKLLAAKKYSPFRKASAWTALSRYFLKEKKWPELKKAAAKALDTEPRLFRIKWYAFRLAEIGDYEEADIALNFLADKIPFTDSETKTSVEIALLAKAERAFTARAAVTRALESSRAGRPVDWDALLDDGEAREFERKALRLAQSGDLAGLEKNLRAKFKDNPRDVASWLLLLAGSFAGAKPEFEYELARRAVAIEPSPANLRAFFHAAQRSARLMDALDAINRYGETVSHFSPDLELDALEDLYKSRTWVLNSLNLAVRDLAAPPFRPSPGRIAYVLHNSLPYSSGGYATRSRGMAAGLRAAGFDVRVITRPGFPLDIVKNLDAADVPEEPDIIDGVPYYRILEPRRKGLSAREYAEAAAKSLEAKFRELKPEIVIAASNHTTALPAYIAAARLGIPFVYEVRGLWEITRVSREPAFAASPEFHVNKTFEVELCKRADCVLTLTEGLKAELASRGAPAANIFLAPNACDPEEFKPMPRDEALARKLKIPADVPVIGYVGTFVIYEGLEDLAKACAILKKEGRDFRLLLVGNENASGAGRGPISEEIERIAENAGFSDRLIMPGRVPHDRVRDYYSLVDIAPFPRKPWPVCEIVSPMKPLEAMAMEKVPLVSSVGALKEMVRDGETGLVFEKGSVADLAAKLEFLLDNPEKRRIMGENAANFVAANRSWKIVCEAAAQRINAVLAKSRASA